MKNVDSGYIEAGVLNPGEVITYRKEEDPKQLMLEFMNLTDLLSKALTTVGQLRVTGGYLNIWKLRQKIRGLYDFDPFPFWKGRTVKAIEHPEWGEGIIKAVKLVDHWYIPGIEFAKEIPEGHCLKSLDAGDPGQMGHCQWLWLDTVEFLD